MSNANDKNFAHSIRLGLGRAQILLAQDNSARYRDLILDAALHNKAYDPQVEGSRAKYLVELMDRSGSLEPLAEAIYSSFDSEADEWDLSQRFGIARLLAQRGDERARASLMDYFRRAPFSILDSLAEEIILLDGLPGLVVVADQIGLRIKTNELEWADDGLIGFASDLFDRESVAKSLQEASEQNQNVRGYLDAISRQKHRNVGAPRVNPETLGYGEIRALIQAGNSGGMLRQWAKTAGAGDLALAANDLAVEDDPSLQRAYLLIFREVKFPLPPDRLFELAAIPDIAVSRHALSALSNISDPRVRELATELVESGSSKRNYAIDLLIQNYSRGDHSILEGWLDREGDEDMLQASQLRLLEYYRVNPNEESEVRVLVKLYDRVPCAHCRCSLVERLFRLDRLPASLKLECIHDSYEETRDLVKLSS